LIWFRIKKFGDKLNYKVPGGYVIPIISILTIIWVLSNLPIKELEAMSLFIIILTIIYLVFKYSLRKNI